jgi:hypothetical protein
MTYSVKVERQNGMLMDSPYTGFPTEENNRGWEDLIDRKGLQLHGSIQLTVPQPFYSTPQPKK